MSSLPPCPLAFELERQIALGLPSPTALPLRAVSIGDLSPLSFEEQIRRCERERASLLNSLERVDTLLEELREIEAMNGGLNEQQRADLSKRLFMVQTLFDSPTTHSCHVELIDPLKMVLTDSGPLYLTSEVHKSEDGSFGFVHTLHIYADRALKNYLRTRIVLVMPDGVRIPTASNQTYWSTRGEPAGTRILL
jgi:hypothetical protein